MTNTNNKSDDELADEFADAVAIRRLNNGRGFDLDGMAAKKAMQEREREWQAMHDREQARRDDEE